jgi:hypothetical protein
MRQRHEALPAGGAINILDQPPGFFYPGGIGNDERCPFPGLLRVG